MKKTIIISFASTFVLIIISIVVLGCYCMKTFGLSLILHLADTDKPSKYKIITYVETDTERLLDAVDEVKQLSQTMDLSTAEKLVRIDNAQTNEYSDGVDGLCAHIDGLGVSRNVEFNNDFIKNILNGNPIRSIAVDDGIIIFDCGGWGIAPSSRHYAFYYSPNDEPFAVFDGRVVCDSSQMSKNGGRYKYTDNSANVFYTEKIKDKFYFCEAVF